VRLFLTKYVAALLFVTLQVTLFSLASFLVLGLRAGAWEPSLFLAIPIMVAFFSYLFSICAFLGMVTRSTMVALLLTLLAWFAIFLLHSGESGIMTFKLMAEQQVERTEGRIEALQKDLQADSEESRGTIDSQLVELRSRLKSDQEKLDSGESSLSKLTLAHDIIYGIKTVLPKTTETIALLERWLIKLAELPKIDQDDEAFQANFGNGVNRKQLEHELVQAVRSRSVGWVMGTSLAFEGVLWE